jgi:hypothetical protein
MNAAAHCAPSPFAEPFALRSTHFVSVAKIAHNLKTRHWSIYFSLEVGYDGFVAGISEATSGR